MNNEDAVPADSPNLATPPLDTPQPARNEPLVELRFKPWVFVFLLLVFIWCMWFSIFGAIVPYLKTGDFAEIWPAHEHNVFEKQVIFVFAWILWLVSPVLFLIFRVGVVVIYETHVELWPYLWFIKKLAIPYDAMHVTDNTGVMQLTKGVVPLLRENPYKYWKLIYSEGIKIPLNGMVLSNPEALQQALQIVRERAFGIDKS